MAGSLRQWSLNRALLRAAAAVAPERITVEVFELAEVPPYNGDLDESLGGGPDPHSVRELKDRVEAADALLLICPEYNWGPSGVLKNAIDWISRPAGSSPLAHKPIALAGASPGPAGTGRAQLALRQNLLSTKSYVLQEPEVQLGGAGKLFDEQLELVDEQSRELVVQQLDALAEWTQRHARAAA